MLSFYLHTGRTVFPAGGKKESKRASIADFKFSFPAMRINVYSVFILFSKEEKGTES